MKPDKPIPFDSPKECQNLSSLLKRRDGEPSDDDVQFRDYLLRDALTGLPNRFKLINDISVNEAPVLFIINIDQFNQVNNLFGLESGDAILVSLAGKLSYHLHDYPSSLYKLQADEYAVLMNITDEEIPWDEIEKIAGHLISSVENDRISVTANRIRGGYDVALNVTIGISVARIVGKDNLVTAADMALKTAKKLRVPFLFYKQSKETRKKYEKNIYWAAIIKDAINDDRIVPYFQPILNNVTGKIEKYEALVRLVNKKGAAIPPNDFIELSKVIRIYSSITRVMIRKSFNAIRDNSFGLSINVGVQDILDQELIKYIIDSMSSLAIGKRLTFEILESEGIENYKEVSTFVNQFKEMGCKVSIDDFGTGYSNFSHLIQLKVDFIKIDASLIRNIVSDNSSRLLVKSIVSFAKEMGIKTVAEYVHSGPVYEVVKGIGVDYAQGYYIGEPRPNIR